MENGGTIVNISLITHQELTAELLSLEMFRQQENWVSRRQSRGIMVGQRADRLSYYHRSRRLTVQLPAGPVHRVTLATLRMHQ
jgi:hypothetical protein